jgi:terminase small subunit / prophage DNA-packing protein
MPNSQPKYKGYILNRVELAEYMGVSLPTIDDWRRRGCPYVEKADRAKGVPWKFNSADVVNWRVYEDRPKW